MQLGHFARLIIDPFGGLELGTDRAGKSCKNAKQAVANHPVLFERNRQCSLLILLVCAVQCVIPYLSAATALAQDKTVTHSGAFRGSVMAPETRRPQAEPTALISMLEPAVVGGSGANRGIITPGPSHTRVPARSSISRVCKVSPDCVSASNSAAAPDRDPERDTQPYGFPSSRWDTSLRDTEADSADGGYVLDSGKLGNGPPRMLADGPRDDFKPLINIDLGGYQLPVFLYTPEPQAHWPHK